MQTEYDEAQRDFERVLKLETKDKEMRSRAKKEIELAKVSSTIQVFPHDDTVDTVSNVVQATYIFTTNGYPKQAISKPELKTSSRTFYYQRSKFQKRQKVQKKALETELAAKYGLDENYKEVERVSASSCRYL